MSDKIKELAVKAGAIVTERSGGTDYGTLDLDVEKFAELIVRDCCKMMVDLEVKYAVNLTVREIKKTYGVA